MKTAEHLSQAYHNETLAFQFGNPPLEAYDWAITALFYCALHFVDAYLFELRSIDPEGHTDLKGNVEEGAVVQDGGVVVRQAARSGVEIEVAAFVELADLFRARGLLDRVPTAHGVAAATGAFLGFEFDRLLRGGGCLLMLDGLDEVVSREERGRVRQQVENLVNQRFARCAYRSRNSPYYRLGGIGFRLVVRP
jgi:hypothetical protein